MQCYVGEIVLGCVLIRKSNHRYITSRNRYITSRNGIGNSPRIPVNARTFGRCHQCFAINTFKAWRAGFSRRKKVEGKLLVREPDLVSRLLCKLKGVLIRCKKALCVFKLCACEYAARFSLVSLQYGYENNRSNFCLILL